MVQYTVIG